MLEESELFIRSYCTLLELSNVLITSFGDDNNLVENVIKGIADNPLKNIELIYLETSKPKYEQIRNKYAFTSFVNCINIYPISLVDFNDFSESKDNIDKEELNEDISKEMRYVIDNDVGQGYLDYIKHENNISLCILNHCDITTILELKYLINKSPSYFIRNNSLFMQDIKNIFDTYGYRVLYEDSKYTMFSKPEIFLYFED